MTKYVSLPFNQKLNLLREHSMGCDWPDLDQEQWCLHCGRKIQWPLGVSMAGRG